MVFCRFCFSSDSDEEKSRRGKSPKAEFKDEEETVTTKHIHITQATETTTTRHKRTANPSKTIDLGAAAHYTGDKASPEQNIAAHTAQSAAKVREQSNTTEHDFTVLLICVAISSSRFLLHSLPENCFIRNV